MVGSLCIDGTSSMLSEVNFYNSVEWAGIAQYYYPLCSSSTCTGE